MTRHGFVIEQLRSANPIPETQTIEAAESVDLLELIDERRIDEAYPTRLWPTDPPKRRPALVAALSTFVIFVVAGASMVALNLRDSDGPTSTTTEIPEADRPTVSDPAPQPSTVTPPLSSSPTIAASSAVWTTFTAETGLPGDDVIAIDVSPDGTTWAMIALDRLRTIRVGQRVLEDFPGRLGLAVFDGTAWKAVEPPVELEGRVELAAGPDGTAWLVGGAWLPQELGFQPSMGTQGLWFFDGTEWITHFEGSPGPGDVRPVGAETGPDGVLWSTGFKADGSGEALLHFDGDTWTTVELPERFRGVLNPGATVYHIDSSGDPWVLYDFGPSLGRSFVQMSRFNGDTWTDFEGGPWEDLFSGPWSDYVSNFWVQDDVGGFVYIIVALPSLEAEPNSSAVKALPGDPIDYRITHFDGTTWGDLESRQLALPEAFSTDPDWRIRAVAASADDLYVSDLGGLKRVDHATGAVTTLDVGDGLASDDIRDIVVGPDDTIWIATDAGISRYMPALGD